MRYAPFAKFFNKFLFKIKVVGSLAKAKATAAAAAAARKHSKNFRINTTWHATAAAMMVKSSSSVHAMLSAG